MDKEEARARPGPLSMSSRTVDYGSITIVQVIVRGDGLIAMSS